MNPCRGPGQMFDRGAPSGWFLWEAPIGHMASATARIRRENRWIQAEYLAYLRARCSASEGMTVRLTASHNDLTMWNVLVDGQAPWESWTGRPPRTPASP